MDQTQPPKMEPPTPLFAERYEIIEYLKVMGNPAFGDPPDAALPGPPTCPKTLQGPAGSGP